MWSRARRSVQLRRASRWLQHSTESSSHLAHTYSTHGDAYSDSAMTTMSLALLVWRKPLYVCAPRCLHAWSSTAAISQRPDKSEQVRARPLRVKITARATVADVRALLCALGCCACCVVGRHRLHRPAHAQAQVSVLGDARGPSQQYRDARATYVLSCVRRAHLRF